MRHWVSDADDGDICHTLPTDGFFTRYIMLVIDLLQFRDASINLGPHPLGSNFTVTLTPMMIRTFQVSFHWVLTGERCNITLSIAGRLQWQIIACRISMMVIILIAYYIIMNFSDIDFTYTRCLRSAIAELSLIIIPVCFISLLPTARSIIFLY